MDLLKAVLKAIVVVGISIGLVTLVIWGLHTAPILTIILFFFTLVIIGAILFYCLS